MSGCHHVGCQNVRLAVAGNVTCQCGLQSIAKDVIIDSISNGGVYCDYCRSTK